MAVRRERERQAVLAEAVAEMRRRGRPEFKAKDLFMDFNGIQVTLAVMAQALIVGKIYCKTAGTLVVELQTFSKLLWIMQRAKTKTLPLINTDDTDLRGAKEPRFPQISADGRRLSKEKDSTTKDTPSTPLLQTQGRSEQATEHKAAIEEKSAKNWATGQHADAQITFMQKMVALADVRGRPHGPPGWARAA